MDGNIDTGYRPPLSQYTQQLLTELGDIFVNRGASYSDFSDNSRVSQDLSRAFGTDADTGTDDTTTNGVEMLRHKLSRLAASGWNHRDSWLDIAGFALLIAANQDRTLDMANRQRTTWPSGYQHPAADNVFLQRHSGMSVLSDTPMVNATETL